MNVLPNSTVYEGEILEVVCRVINPPTNIEVFLTRDRRILKQAQVALNHRFTAQEGDSGELVCKAVWGSVQKETYQTITVKGKKRIFCLLWHLVPYYQSSKLFLFSNIPHIHYVMFDLFPLQQSCFRSHAWLWTPLTYLRGTGCMWPALYPVTPVTRSTSTACTSPSTEIMSKSPAKTHSALRRTLLKTATTPVKWMWLLQNKILWKKAKRLLLKQKVSHRNKWIDH